MRWQHDCSPPMDHQLQSNSLEAYGRGSFGLAKIFETFSVIGKIEFSKEVIYEN